MKADAFLAPFRKMKASAFALWEKIAQERTIPKVKNVMKEEWDMDISDEDAQLLLAVAEKYQKEKLPEYYAIGEWSSRSTLMWVSQPTGTAAVMSHSMRMAPGNPWVSSMVLKLGRSAQRPWDSIWTNSIRGSL